MVLAFFLPIRIYFVEVSLFGSFAGLAKFSAEVSCEGRHPRAEVCVWGGGGGEIL